MDAKKNNIGAYIDVDFACAKHLIVAGSGTDNSEKTGDTIDRKQYGSGKLSCSYIADLAATKTLSLTINEQQSDDDSSWDTATAVLAKTVMLTGASGGSTGADGVYTVDINFQDKKRYLRYNITCDLSNTSTDTASFTCVMIKGGADIKPAA